MFKIGDKVLVLSGPYEKRIGHIGVIKCIDDSEYLDVQFIPNDQDDGVCYLKPDEIKLSNLDVFENLGD